MGGWVEVEQALERRARSVVLAGVVVGPAECLEDRCLAGLLAVGPLEDGRRLGEMALLEERRAALKELVRRLAIAVGLGRLRGALGVFGHDAMVARSRGSLRKPRAVPRARPRGIARSAPVAPGSQIDRLEPR